MAIKALEQEPEWIPVSERLPEDKTYVLTTIKVPNRIAHARSGWYEGGFFHNDNGDTWKATDREVKAWIPLPEPYKAESEGKGMSDSFEFTLHSPLTKEDWNKLSDAELENTMSVTFQTPQGRQVRFIKCEVLDKIRAEIDQYLFQNEFGSAYRKEVSQIIDKYKTESEDKE